MLLSPLKNSKNDLNITLNNRFLYQVGTKKGKYKVHYKTNFEYHRLFHNSKYYDKSTK